MSYYEDLNLQRGTDFAMRLDFINDEDTPLDLTGYDIKGFVKKSVSEADSDAIVMGVVPVLPKSNGTIFLMLENNQTSLMDARRYYYDVRAEYDDSTGALPIISKTLTGRLNVSD